MQGINVQKNFSIASLGLFATLLGVPSLAQAAPDKAAIVSLRRLTQDEYRNSIADIFGKDIEVRGVFEPERRVGGLQAASTAILSVTPAGFESFTKMADSIAAQVTAEKYRARLPCAPKAINAPDDSCAAQILGRYGKLLFRRPLEPDDLKSRIKLSNGQAKASKDFYTGLRYGLASLIQAPEFVFRKETAVSSDGTHYALEPFSRATRLSFLMWNTAPDEELLNAAASGELKSPAGLDSQVNRLMSSPRLDTGMRAFFNDMLELDTFDTIAKDSLLYAKWGTVIANSAKEETLRTSVDLALHSNGDMRDLMTTRKTFINRALAADYQIAFPFKGDWMPYEFDTESGRSGVLTHASMLAMFSHPGRSSPTKRGVAVMDIFLCEPTPTPPANVDFSIVNDTSGTLKTVRERLMAHAGNPTCASCHNHSDPIGLSLEGFDTIGGRRTSENGQKIDLSVAIQGKTFVGAEGLGRYLHDNPKYPTCVARKLQAYARGENSEDVPASAIRPAYKSFAESGFRMRALLKSLVEAPDFFNAPAPEPASSSAGKVASK